MPPAKSRKRSTKAAKEPAEEVCSEDHADSDVAAIRALLNKAQRGVQGHEKCGEALGKLLRKRPDLSEELLACVGKMLLVFKKEQAIERLVNFIAKVAAREDGPEANWPNMILQFVLDRSGAKDKAVRYRACQIVGSLTRQHNIGEEEVSNLVLQKMLPRLRDKVPAVRIQAIESLAHFQQDPNSTEEGDDDEGDRVTSELVRMMSSDSSKDVRRAALRNIQVSPHLIPELTKRARDLHADVRQATYEVLAQKVPLELLTVSQRVALLEWGLSDRAEGVCNACKAMLCRHWISVGEHTLDFLKQLDVMGSESTATKALVVAIELGLESEQSRGGEEHLSVTLSLEESKCMRDLVAHRVNFADGITPESALFVRVQAEVVSRYEGLAAAEKQDRLEDIMPDTPTLCGFLEVLATTEGFSEDFNVIFIAQQLLKVAKVIDMSEEAGRRRLVALLKMLLTSQETPFEVLEVALGALASASSSEADYIQVVAEWISDMSAESEAGPGEGEEDIDVEEIEDRRITLQARCLELISALLEHSTRTLSDGTLAHMEQYILPALTSPYGYLRELGVACLGKYCLLGEAAALRHRAVLLTYMSNSEEEVSPRGQAVSAITDLCMVFGDVMMGEDGDVARKMLDMLRDDKVHMGLKAIVCEACAKLLFAGRLRDRQGPPILAEVLAIYFMPGSCADPATLAALLEAAKEWEEGEPEEEVQGQGSTEDVHAATAMGSPVRLQQVLSMLFNSFALAGDIQRQVLREAIGPLLTCLEAHETSLKASDCAGPDQSIPAEKAIACLATLLSQGPAQLTDAKEQPKPPDPEGEGEEEDEKAQVTPVADPADEASTGLGLLSLHICHTLLGIVNGEAELGDFTLKLCKSLVALPPPADQEVLKMVRELVERIRESLPTRTKDRGASAKLLVKYATTCEAVDLTPNVKLPAASWRKQAPGLKDVVPEGDDDDDSEQVEKSSRASTGSTGRRQKISRGAKAAAAARLSDMSESAAASVAEESEEDESEVDEEAQESSAKKASAGKAGHGRASRRQNVADGEESEESSNEEEEEVESASASESEEEAVAEPEPKPRGKSRRTGGKAAYAKRASRSSTLSEISNQV